MNIYSLQVFPDYACSSVDLTNINDRLASVNLDTEWSFIKKELTRVQATKQIMFRTFLDTNLRDCSCTCILKHMYSEILGHYKEIGEL